MPKAEGGLPISRPIWSLAADPPLSLRDISPRKGGGKKGIREFFRAFLGSGSVCDRWSVRSLTLPDNAADPVGVDIELRLVLAVVA